VEDRDLVTEAITKQSRLLADIEVIESRDIIMGDNNFKAVPDNMIGKRRLDIGMKHRPRRWWGQVVMTQMYAEEKQRKNAEKESND
jgi:hypothetical protein